MNQTQSTNAETLLKSNDGGITIGSKKDEEKMRLASVQSDQEKEDDDDERTTLQKLESEIKYPTKQYMEEIKAMRKNPNPIVELVCGAVMETLGHMNDWKNFLKVVSNPDKFIKQMKAFDMKNAPHLVYLLQKYADNEQFTDLKTINRISKAAGCLAKWVLATHAYVKEFLGDSLSENAETKQKADEYMFKLRSMKQTKKRPQTGQMRPRKNNFRNPNYLEPREQWRPIRICEKRELERLNSMGQAYCNLCVGQAGQANHCGQCMPTNPHPMHCEECVYGPPPQKQYMEYQQPFPCAYNQVQRLHEPQVEYRPYDGEIVYYQYQMVPVEQAQQMPTMFYKY